MANRMRGICAAAVGAAFIAVGANAQGCGEDAVIFALHAFDVSWSHSHAIQSSPPFLEDLEETIRGSYFKTKSAVVSFSDKPQGPYGDKNGDYCYRQDRVFSEESVVGVASGLEILSGRDWKESQLEAIMRGLQSETLGWAEYFEGKVAQSAIILTTDALPHVSGDFGGCNDQEADCDDPCLLQDYPTVDAVNDAAGSKGASIIFLVTGDVYNAWVDLVAGKPNLHVVWDDSENVKNKLDGIEEVLCANVPDPFIFRSTDSRSTCNDVCAEDEMVCDEQATLAANASTAACRNAVEGLIGGPVTDSGESSDEQLAEGCNFSFFQRVSYLKVGANMGCAAAPAEGLLKIYDRVCGCKTVPPP